MHTPAILTMPLLASHPFHVVQDVEQKIKRDFLSTYLGTDLNFGQQHLCSSKMFVF
jgi:hypothetical protein